MTMFYFTPIKIQLKVVVLLFILLVSSVNVLQAQSYSRYNDSLALVALYNATDGPNWINSKDNYKNWLSGPLDGWYGISIDSYSKRVNKVELIGNNLTGKIPSSIGNLNSLRYLLLQNNSLYDTIPSGIKDLGFRGLNVQNNYFDFTDLAFSEINPTVKTNFTYHPQNILPAPFISQNGSEITLTVQDKNPNNHYIWFANGDTIANNNSFTYTFTPTETVSIKVQITNSIFTKLILETETITIVPNPRVIVKNPNPICSPNTIDLTSTEILSGVTEGSTFSYYSDIDTLNKLTNEEAVKIGVSGTYYIVVTSKSGTREIFPVDVIIYPKPTLKSTVVNIECAHESSGIIDLTVLGGTAPYRYNWSNGHNTQDINDLPEGDYEVIVSDANGCNVDSIFVINQLDTEKPQAFAKNITLQIDQNGTALITAEQINDGSSDNCGIASMTINPSDFDCSSVGQNQVILTVTDVNGNSSSAQATVIVEEKTAPVAIAKNITVQLGESGAASITAEQINDGSSDNCGIASMTINPSDFECSSIGQNQVIFTVTDVNGNSSSAQATVIVEEKTAPVAIAKNITVQLGESGAASITAEQINDGSSDNCGIASMTINPSDFDCSSIGQNQVIFTVTDVNGNSSSAQATVTVEEKTAPVAIAKNITVKLGESGVAFITAEQINDGSSDNCGIASMTINPSDFDCSSIGSNQVTLTVTDVNGNSSSAQATVTVEEKTAPVAIAKNITVQLGESGVASITAEQINDGSSDNCGIASMTINPSDFDCSSIGSNQVTLTVTDVNGNSSSTQATVTIEDKIAPTVVAQNISIALDENGTASISAIQINNGSSDNCEIASMTIYPSVFGSTSVGENSVILTVTDVSGNTSTANSIITVTDIIAPKVATKNATVTLDQNGSATVCAMQIDNGSSDACGIAQMVVSPCNFNTVNIGENTVTLTVTDVNGNSASAKAIVTVSEITVPTVITQNVIVALNENGAVSIVASQIDNGSSDNNGIFSMSVSPSDFNCSDIGDNIVTLTVTDVSGNSASAAATVTIQDKMAPTIIAPPSITKTIENKSCGSGGVTVDLGAPTVGDNCSIKEVSNNAPKTFPYGTTIVTWTATDKSGNISTATQSVEIIKGSTNKIPVINSITSNSPVYIKKAAKLTAVFTDDNLKTAIWSWGDGATSAGTISGNQITGSHYYSETGMYDVTLTITDTYGKSASKIYSYVIVFDPDNGDVTGGGWMNTQRGDYRLKSTCEKGNFGFCAQYDKNLNLKGNLTFHINGVNFHVSSTSLDWLLVDNDHALFKGKAKVNCNSGYEFLVSAVDIDMKKSCNHADDLLRIIVWNSKGDVIFDNQDDDSMFSRPTDGISQGSIVIHGNKRKCSDSDLKSFDLNEPAPENEDIVLFDNLRVYPNPAINILHVEIPNRDEQSVSADIIDVSGKVVAKELRLELYGQYGWIDLDKFNMAPGVYILKLNEIDGTKTSRMRFIKK
jgi:hypothetical protein